MNQTSSLLSLKTLPTPCLAVGNTFIIQAFLLPKSSNLDVSVNNTFCHSFNVSSYAFLPITLFFVYLLSDTVNLKR